jgi:chromosome segregation ATPase
MNLLQTESGAKIKELEEAKVAVEVRVRSLEKDGESAAAEQERITGEWRKASTAAEDAHIEIDKFRRLSDENKVEHDRLHEVQEKLRTATAKLGDLEQQQKTMEEQNSMAVKVLHNELSTLRDRIADILGLEKRRWETDSLLHAVTQKLATKDQKVNEVSPLSHAF